MSKTSSGSKTKEKKPRDVQHSLQDALQQLVHQARRHVPATERAWHRRYAEVQAALAPEAENGGAYAESSATVDKGESLP
jgi:hypothetical protein